MAHSGAACMTHSPNYFSKLASFNTRMAHFFIIGGSESVAATWTSVRRHLRAADHQASALGWAELPWHDGVEEVAIWLEQKTAALKEVILVGHSAAGLLLPRIKGANILGNIYLAALVPRPGESFIGQMFDCPVDVFDEKWIESASTAKELISGTLEKLYHTSLACWAESSRTLAYIVCDQDQEIRPEWQRWAAAHLLKVQPQVLPAAHLAQITHAVELSALFSRIAQDWLENAEKPAGF